MDPQTIQQAFEQAVQHHRAGRLVEAETLYRQILATDPRHADALHLLGCIAVQAGRSDVAVDLIRLAVAIKPGWPEALDNLGTALHNVGRFDEALAAHRMAISLRPDFADTYYNLGNVFMAKGLLDDAIVAYRQSLKLDPNKPKAHNNLGVAFKDKNLLDEAIAAYRQAIAVKPDYAEAYSNLGNVLKDKGQLDAAIAAHTQAIALNPNYSDGHYNLGNLLADNGQLDAAIAAGGRAVAINPNHSKAHNNLGIALRDNGQADEAIASYRRAIAADPQNWEAHSNLLLMLQYHPASTDTSIADELRRWNRQFGQPLRGAIQPHANNRDPDRRLRIGYVSSDFREHVVGRNLLPLFQHHDRQAFEIFCYSNVTRADEITAEFEQLCDGWRNIQGTADDRVAGRIREDRIDILVDLGLHTARNRLLVFARKPAPVQVTFAGYPGSTGLDTIDYRLSDPYLDPPGVDGSVYSEKTIRLPHSFWCYAPPAGAEIPIHPPPMRQNGFITFGCLNNYCKINDGIFTIWANVLRRVEGSHLLLLGQIGAYQPRTLDKLRQEGIDPSRVEFLQYQPRREYLQSYHRVDIGLDSFPYNGHTTSLDSFWMGVPVVTLVGKRIVSRAGWCQLSNLGMMEFAAETAGQFADIAVNLAIDPPRLEGIRSTLRGRMEQSPLMNPRKFAKDIESAYRRMWHTWCESDSTNR